MFSLLICSRGASILEIYTASSAQSTQSNILQTPLPCLMSSPSHPHRDALSFYLNCPLLLHYWPPPLASSDERRRGLGATPLLQARIAHVERARAPDAADVVSTHKPLALVVLVVKVEFAVAEIATLSGNVGQAQHAELEGAGARRRGTGDVLAGHGARGPAERHVVADGGELGREIGVAEMEGVDASDVDAVGGEGGGRGDEEGEGGED